MESRLLNMPAKISNIIYLDQNRFDFYSETQNKLYNFDLSSYASNLEITDKNGLHEQIKNFVGTAQIPVDGIVIVLADSLLFIKGVKEADESSDEDEGEVRKFVDSVPFEHVTYKTYPIEGGDLVVAANRDFYGTIKNAFEKIGFDVDFVLPVYSAQVTIDANNPFSESTARTILKNAPVLRKNGLEISEKQLEPAPIITNQKPNKKRFIFLIGIFALLIIVLVVVIINSQNTPPSAAPKVATPGNSTPILSPPITPNATTAAVLDKTALKIKVSGPASAAVTSQAIKSNLTNLGYAGIQQEINSNAPVAPVVVFASSVAPFDRTQIINSISLLVTNFTIQESQNPGSDVIIFLSR